MMSRAFEYFIGKPARFLVGQYFRLNPKHITCREFNNHIFDHIEQNLTEEENVLFQRHMHACPICRNFLKTYIATYKAKDHLYLYKDIHDLESSVPRLGVDE